MFSSSRLSEVPLHRQELTLQQCLLVPSEHLYTCRPVSGDAPRRPAKLVPKPVMSAEKPLRVAPFSSLNSEMSSADETADTARQCRGRRYLQTCSGFLFFSQLSPDWGPGSYSDQEFRWKVFKRGSERFLARVLCFQSSCLARLPHVSASVHTDLKGGPQKPRAARRFMKTLRS